MTYRHSLPGFFIAFLFLLSGCSASLFGSHSKFIQYPLGKGETVESIAERFSITPQDIEKLNSHIKRKPPVPGDYLKVPYNGESLEKTKQAWLTQLKGQKGSRQVSTIRVKQYLGKLKVPVTGAKLTSKFGNRSRGFHEGIDLALPIGSPIHAAHDGKVVFVSNSFGGYGRAVVLEGDGLLTVYAHNSSNHVDVGELVDRNEVIAEVGQSGDATGPHVHFETRIKDERGKYVAVDPSIFLEK